MLCTDVAGMGEWHRCRCRWWCVHVDNVLHDIYIDIYICIYIYIYIDMTHVVGNVCTLFIRAWRLHLPLHSHRHRHRHRHQHQHQQLRSRRRSWIKLTINNPRLHILGVSFSLTEQHLTRETTLYIYETLSSSPTHCRVSHLHIRRRNISLCQRALWLCDMYMTRWVVDILQRTHWVCSI